MHCWHSKHQFMFKEVSANRILYIKFGKDDARNSLAVTAVFAFNNYSNYPLRREAGSSSMSCSAATCCYHACQEFVHGGTEMDRAMAAGMSIWKRGVSTSCACTSLVQFWRPCLLLSPMTCHPSPAIVLREVQAKSGFEVAHVSSITQAFQPGTVRTLSHS